MGRRKTAAERLSSDEAKAIDHYQKTKGAVVQLSTLPNVRFKIEESGQYVEVPLHMLVHQYTIDKEESKRERLQEKRRQEQEAANKQGRHIVWSK